MSLIPDGDGERKIDAAINRMFAEGLAKTDAAMAQGVGMLRIREAGLAAGIPHATIAKSQERFLAMKKRHEVPGPTEVSPEAADKILAGSTIGGFRATPWAKSAQKDLLVDSSIRGTPAIILPLPTPAATLTASIEMLESLAATMDLPSTGSVVLHASATPHQILLRWVAK